MDRKDFYDTDTYEALLRRIDQLSSEAMPGWGTMNAAQMCAHCAEVAEVASGKALVGTPWYIRLMGGLIKKMVVSKKPYPRGARTHPQFEFGTEADFAEQKARLVRVLDGLHSGGRARAAERTHPLFGAMTADEHGWLTYKHLDHHLTQFGV